jgi:hypothetical protein
MEWIICFLSTPKQALVYMNQYVPDFRPLVWLLVLHFGCYYLWFEWNKVHSFHRQLVGTYSHSKIGQTKLKGYLLTESISIGFFSMARFDMSGTYCASICREPVVLAPTMQNPMILATPTWCKQSTLMQTEPSWKRRMFRIRCRARARLMLQTMWNGSCDFTESEARTLKQRILLASLPSLV